MVPLAISVHLKVSQNTLFKESVALDVKIQIACVFLEQKLTWSDVLRFSKWSHVHLKGYKIEMLTPKLCVNILQLSFYCY